MKFRDLILRTRDGKPRPPKESIMLVGMLTLGDHACQHCGELDICAYDIQVDGFFCSDECRASYRVTTA